MRRLDAVFQILLPPPLSLSRNKISALVRLEVCTLELSGSETKVNKYYYGKKKTQ